MRGHARAAAAAAALAAAQAFYLPGYYPQTFAPGQRVPVKIGKVSSTSTHLPYHYYDGPFCHPDNAKTLPANLGEVLTGDIMHTSGYELEMMVNKTCVELCAVDDFAADAHKLELFDKFVSQRYRMNMRMDSMPAVALVEVPASPGEARGPSDDLGGAELAAKKFVGLLGLQIGHERGGQAYVNNHINFWILYHPLESDEEGTPPMGRVIAMYVATRSSSEACGAPPPADGSPAPEQPAKGRVAFTYSVRWVPTDTKWATRWDPLLQMSQQDVATNSFAVVNSLLVTLCVSGVVAMILVRSLKRDLLRYEEIEEMLGEDGEAPYEDFGWKVVANDVFRKPPHHEALCWMVGSGAQLFWTTMVVLALSLAGAFSPSNRGMLATVGIVCFALLGCVAGYHSAKLNACFGAERRRTIAINTAMWFPGTVFTTFLALDLIIWSQGSSGAVPFTTLLLLAGIWFLISTPLVFVGTYAGYKQDPVPWPVKINQIPRLIPEAPWYRRGAVMCLMAGSIPFAVSFTQLFFVLSRLWLNQFVYMFGFIAVAFLITCVAAAEVAIITVYFTLQAEDYRWMWRAFAAPGCAAGYMYAFVASYFLTSLPASTAVTNAMILLWLFMLAAYLFLILGSVGFQASLMFTRGIYAAIKSD